MGKARLYIQIQNLKEVGVNSKCPENSLVSVILSKFVCHDQSEPAERGLCSRKKARQGKAGKVPYNLIELVVCHAYGLILPTHFCSLSHA